MPKPELEEAMKTSEKLYNINAEISIRYIATKKKPTKEVMMQINEALGEIIKEVRALEGTR